MTTQNCCDLSKSKTRKTYKNKLILKPMREGYTHNHAKNEAYNGGRSLRAIWTNPNITSTQSLVLLCISSHLDFKKDFKSWIKISISQIASETKLGVRTVHKIISELIKLEYLNKQRNFSQKTFLQEESSFCLTNKLFDEHVNYLQKSLVPTSNHNEHVKEYKFQKSLKSSNKKILQSATPAKQVRTPYTSNMHDMQSKVVRDADIFPLDLSSLKLSPQNSPMCEEKISHTIENPIAYKSNNSELKQVGIIICELLKQKQKRKFIPNMECESLIAKAKLHLDLNNCDQFLSFAKAAIANEHYNNLNNSKNIESIFINEVKSFIDNKEYIASFKAKEITECKKESIEQIANRFKAPVEQFLGQALTSVHAKQNEPLKAKETRQSSLTDGLSDSALAWYKNLDRANKIIVQKEIKKHGPAKFSSLILPSIKSYKNFVTSFKFEARAA
ncbi:hypothetical protein GCL60_16725 [Silvanigrella paludirubra]|uniref:Helix-turn-helix domain-containing protein n=1 Tax=Silvanigrella paludirubra TaxID=2499159 RepID=A0A6N6VNA9_9BACT|nr:hypothetical protein [Silvanigrella paludirubra]KAB8035874.1 hypothetical protein GCL60_16725 [Silvanigrella paludirubra]